MDDHFIRREAAQVTGAIYYVSYGQNGPIKIGFANGVGAVNERLRGIQTACPYDLIALAVRGGTMADERKLHLRFQHLRLRGEWFMRAPDLIKHVNGARRRVDCRSWLPSLSAYSETNDVFLTMTAAGRRRSAAIRQAERLS